MSIYQDGLVKMKRLLVVVDFSSTILCVVGLSNIMN